MSNGSRLLFSAALLIASVACAHAQNPIIDIKVEWGGGAYAWYSGGYLGTTYTPTPNPNVWQFTGGWNTAEWACTWEGLIDPDPFVNSVVALTNNMASTETFIMTLTLPTTGAIPAPSLAEGGVTVSTSGPGGSTLATPTGDFMYTAQVGGASIGPLGELLGDPFSLVAPGVFPVSHGPVNFSGAGPALPDPGSIGIRFAFTLSPGDSATLNGTFSLTPEPTSLVLLLLGGVALFGRRA